MKSFLKIVSVAALIGLSAAPAMAQTTGASATTSSTATGRVISPLTITAGSVLAFGTVVKPTAGSYAISVDTADSRGASTANSYIATTTATAATFSITGESGQAATLAFGASNLMTLNGPSGSTIAVTLVPSATTTTLPSGADSFKVGGTFTLPSGQTTGTYTGTLAALVSYD